MENVVQIYFRNLQTENKLIRTHDYISVHRHVRQSWRIQLWRWWVLLENSIMPQTPKQIHASYITWKVISVFKYPPHMEGYSKCSYIEYATVTWQKEACRPCYSWRLSFIILAIMSSTTKKIKTVSKIDEFISVKSVKVVQQTQVISKILSL
jgi:hypothetical protein